MGGMAAFRAAEATQATHATHATPKESAAAPAAKDPVEAARDTAGNAVRSARRYVADFIARAGWELVERPRDEKGTKPWDLREQSLASVAAMTWGIFLAEAALPDAALILPAGDAGAATGAVQQYRAAHGRACEGLITTMQRRAKDATVRAPQPPLRPSVRP